MIQNVFQETERHFFLKNNHNRIYKREAFFTFTKIQQT